MQLAVRATAVEGLCCGAPILGSGGMWARGAKMDALMESLREWVLARWQDTLIPLAVFLASAIILWRVRQILARTLVRQVRRAGLSAQEVLRHSLWWPSRVWVLLIATYLGLQASMLPGGWKVPVGRGLWTLFILSVAYSLVRGLGGLIQAYGHRLAVPSYLISPLAAAANILVLAVTGLMLLDLWGAPLAPLLLIILLLALAAAVAFRDILPGFFAFLQMQSAGLVRAGDYIKLETGEEGSVEEMTWRNTRLRATDGSLLLIPNSKLMRGTLVNYGRTLKRATEPFRFHSRAHLKELTGLKARDLRELVAVLKTVPDSVLYYHTHHYLEEHHYLVPEPPNDFVVWVSGALGEEALGEKLAAVDAFEFPSLGALRERLVGIIEEHLAGDGDSRTAPEGEEFHFVKSVSFITATPYVAHDLRELVEVLRKLPLGSLFFHVFESRLRLGRAANDFSVWTADTLGEQQLAEEIAQLDPYNYTLEGLRSALIQLIERRIR